MKYWSCGLCEELFVSTNAPIAVRVAALKFCNNSTTHSNLKVAVSSHLSGAQSPGRLGLHIDVVVDRAIECWGG